MKRKSTDRAGEGSRISEWERHAQDGEILERFRVTLRFLANQMPPVHGFF
jgi:hypothetical protein